MDGRPMGGMPSHPALSGCNDGVRVGETSVKPFRFSSIITTGTSLLLSSGMGPKSWGVDVLDDDDIADPDSVDPDLGCIQVEIHRISTRLPKDRHARQHGQVHDVGPVHERSKKLGAHCVA